MDNKVLLRLVNIKKVFGSQVILNNISINIKKNEFLTLLGPSGCGKTTILRILGGFENPDSGFVMLGEENINNVAPYKRNINTVFQRYALFTHLDVYGNIAFALNIKKMNKKIIKEKVTKALIQVNLQGYEKRSISKLSGGQQQRVAVARAIVNEPEVLLLDEPLSSLDLKLRKEMQYELKSLQQELGITFVYVTHDQEEALTMSDTVVVINDGIIQQMGTPESIYNEPINAFVADFIGESNIYDGIMIRDEVLELFGHTFKCVDKGFNENESIDVVIRPEDVRLTKVSNSQKTTNHTSRNNQLIGKVTDCIFKGVHYETCIETFGEEWVIHDTENFVPGDYVSIEVDPFNIHIMKKHRQVDDDES